MTMNPQTFVGKLKSNRQTKRIELYNSTVHLHYLPFSANSTQALYGLKADASLVSTVA